MSRHPTVKWAQRSDRVYLSIDLPEAKDVELNLDPEGKFWFTATKDGIPYEINIQLLDKINVKESKSSIGVRSISYVVKKADKKWWSRLLKEEGKPPAFVKVDWDKWIDEEDENERAIKDIGNADKTKGKKKKKSKRKKNLLLQLIQKLNLNCICKT